MELYILRHAIAVPRGTAGFPNDDRPLTPEGIARMQKNAKGIVAVADGCTVILSSPLKRAAQTAEITAAVLHPAKGIKISRTLLPGTPPAIVVNMLAKHGDEEGVMLVGHEPDCGLLVSHLIGAPGSVVEFRKGGLCRITLDSVPPHRPGRLIWHLTPKQLRLIA